MSSSQRAPSTPPSDRVLQVLPPGPPHLSLDKDAPGAGRQLVSSSADGSVRLWYVESGRLVRTWRSRDKETYALAVTADGSRVFSGGLAGTIECWSVDQSAPVASFTGHTGPVTDLFISKSGTRLV